MKSLKEWLASRNTTDLDVTRLLVKGYLLLTCCCFLVLLMPFFQHQSIAFIDHLFYAVSIVSTTGLAPTDFGTTYNLGGQILILMFIQLGGVGYMALGSFIVLKQFDRLPLLSHKLLKLEFNLPQQYPVLQFVYSIFIYTIIIEAIGAGFLYIGFLDAGVANPLWAAVFHSVSAFCTAGFSLFPDSFASFHASPLVTNTIMALSLLGSIGFIVLLDFFFFCIRKKKSITLTSKIILITTLILWLFGALHLWISEADTGLEPWQVFRAYLFQSMSAHTTVGFNSLDIGGFSNSALFIFILLMMVGASPAGTGGGVKTTSITALFAVLNSVLRRKSNITFLKKVIPTSNIFLAISSTLFYSIVLGIGTWFLLLTDGQSLSFQSLLFESASALSTVGITTGITGTLSVGGKLLIILLMFIGRIGVLTFGYALVKNAPLIKDKGEEEIVI